MLEITGYLRNTFNIRNEKNSNVLVGALTNGTHKLDLTLNKLEDETIAIERGSKLEITGDLEEEGKKLKKKKI